MIDHPVFGPIFAEPRTLPDGRIAYVCPLLLGRARINVGDLGGVDDGY